MKQYINFSKRLLLLATSAIATSMLAALPSQAATFASSQGLFDFTKFSTSPTETSSIIDAEPLAVGIGNSIVTAFADPKATFIVSPPTASNSSLSQAGGKGTDSYLGLAKSQATIIGKFDVNAGTNFSFDFLGNLSLTTSIGNVPSEKARAFGDISFALLDSSNESILDFFTITGNLTTEGDEDFIDTKKSDNVTFTDTGSNFNFGGKQESITASFGGSLQRYFPNQTNLTLIEVKRNQASVAVPEPSANIAFIFVAGVIGVGLKWKNN